MFEMPEVVQSYGSCGIIDKEVSISNGIVDQPLSGFLDNPFFTFAELRFLVFPQNLSLNKKYEFYVKYTAQGGATLWSSKKTLIVGCTEDVIPLVYFRYDIGPNFYARFNGTSTTNIYFLRPETPLWYCFGIGY